MLPGSGQSGSMMKPIEFKKWWVKAKPSDNRGVNILDKGAGMRIQVYLQMVLLSFLFLLIGTVGYAESDIPMIIQYNLKSAREAESHSVTYKHQAHISEYRISCFHCHHTLEPGAAAVEETCADCHTNTDLRGYYKAEPSGSQEKRLEYHILALHDQCINCHKEIKANNRFAVTPPVACWKCHVRKKK
jgi:hypothetical protein